MRTNDTTTPGMHYDLSLSSDGGFVITLPLSVYDSMMTSGRFICTADGFGYEGVFTPHTRSFPCLPGLSDRVVSFVFAASPLHRPTDDRIRRMLETLTALDRVVTSSELMSERWPGFDQALTVLCVSNASPFAMNVHLKPHIAEFWRKSTDKERHMIDESLSRFLKPENQGFPICRHAPSVIVSTREHAISELRCPSGSGRLTLCRQLHANGKTVLYQDAVSSIEDALYLLRAIIELVRIARGPLFDER